MEPSLIMLVRESAARMILGSGSRCCNAFAPDRLRVTNSRIAKATMKKMAQAIITSSRVNATPRELDGREADPGREEETRIIFIRSMHPELRGVRLDISQAGDNLEPDLPALVGLRTEQHQLQFVTSPIAIEPDVGEFRLRGVLACGQDGFDDDSIRQLGVEAAAGPGRRRRLRSR